ncbi:MFS transporter [Sporobolomyces koalae]|uniref:MFS transporter n=1 Tax=Sporobolomyces koalae TaxID=500713 RepID=UPI00317EE732
MFDLMRDAPLGQILNFVSKGKIFPYPEDRPDYVVPEHLLARTDESHNYTREERTFDNDHVEQNRNAPRGHVDAGTLRKADKPVKRLHPTDHEQNDEREEREPRPRRSDSSSQTRVGEDEGAGRDEEEGAAREKNEKGEKVHKKNVKTEDHWAYKLTADPKKANEDGRHEHYQYLVDWNGDDDPENPQNWSTNKKIFVTADIALLTASVYMGSAIYTPGEQSVMEQFGVSQTASILGLSLFIVGYGLGPMLWSPLQETHQLGRNPVYHATLGIFVLFQVPMILPSCNFGTLLAFRFLTGFFGSPCLATGGATCGDVWDPYMLGYAMAIWSVGAVCGPVLGPVVGAAAAQANGWKWTIWELMWLSGFSFIVMSLFLPETYGPNILYKRARRLRKLTGNPLIMTKEELEAQDSPGIAASGGKMILRAFQLFAEPAVFFANMYIGIIYAIFYLWFEAFPIVFAEKRGFGLLPSTLPFLAFYVSGALTLVVYILYQKWYFIPKLKETELKLAPERRLELAICGSIFIPVSLLIFGWSGQYDYVHWIVPTIGASLYFPGIYYCFQCILLYLAQSYPSVAASVFAGNDFCRSGMAAGFPLFGAAFYHHLGVGGACSLLAGLSALMIIPLIALWKYGHKLRERSKWSQ